MFRLDTEIADEGWMPVQLTIDSSEPLAHVLRVVGSLYGTELTVAPDLAGDAPAADKTAKAPAKAARPAKRTKAAPKKPARRRQRATKAGSARGRRSRAAGPTTADIRTWAQGQGYEISNRGRLAASLVRAYTDAHQ